MYDRTWAHRSALARTWGLPGLEGAQHGATEDIAATKRGRVRVSESPRAPKSG